MTINESSIIKKVKEFANSPKGKKTIQSSRAEAFAKGKNFGKGNGITSPKEFVRAADIYFSVLNNIVKSNEGASESLKEIVSCLKNNSTISKPSLFNKNSINVDITFDKNTLVRESLIYYYNDKKINNILALFNNGMDVPADNTPYGDWEHGGRYYHVKGTTHREALRFMQESIRQYKQKYKDVYNVKSVQLDEEYKK